MKRIPREKAMAYELNKDAPPALRVKLGESFVVETEDAASGLLRSPDRLPIPEHRPTMKFTPHKSNPVGGPIYVEGVEAGDLLVVNIERIVPDTQGFTAVRPGAGPLGDSYSWREATTAYTHIIQHLPGPSGTTRDGTAVFNERFQWPLRPFVGTIGVAPEREVETSVIGQGPWGGNLDCQDMREGVKAFLNCYNDGGLLYVGDVHGSQGDTEFTGTANETRAEVTLSCDVVKRKRIPFPRLETRESLIALYSDKPLEAAVEAAIRGLMDWLVADYAVPKRDAYLLMSVHPDLRVHVYQMARIGRLMFTAGAEFPKRALGWNVKPSIAASKPMP